MYALQFHVRMFTDLLSRMYVKFCEMLNFEGLITSNHKCEIMTLLYSRSGRFTYPKVSSIMISVYAKGNHPEL